MSKALFKLIIAQVFINATMTGLRMAAPLQALQGGYSVAAVGSLVALFALTQMFLAIPVGRYADRNGLKRPIYFSAVAAAGGAGLAALMPTYPILCVSALLAGAAAGTSTISLQRHVGRAAESPTELKQAFGWISIGPAVSNFIGPFAAGIVIDQFGYRAAFLLLAITPLLSFLFIRDAKELPPVESARASHGHGAWQLLRERRFRSLMVINWLLSSCWDVHTIAVPILGHDRGFSASVIGSILAAFAVAATAIRVVIPAIAAHLSEWMVMVAAMGLAALVFVAYPFQHTAIGMGACSVVLGVALGMVQPMMMSTMHQITPEAQHGEALGLRLMSINASSIVVPVVFGMVGAAVGMGPVFWATGLAIGLGMPMAWRIGVASR